LGPKVYILDLVKVIKKLDNYRAQIFVTAKIIEINESKIKNVGLKYGIDAGYSNDNSLYTFASNLGGNSIAVDTRRLNLVLPTATKTIALGTSINLLNKEGALDIISSPSLLCINNKESSIYIGQTKSFKTQSSINNSGVISEQSFKREDIGLKLIITPRISNTNKVLLDINTIIEDVSNTLTNGQPDTSKKEIKTTAIVNSGESVIIGGLIKKSIDTLEDKVAGFSSIPLIGGLFTNEQNVQDKISLVVIITPYVIPVDKDLSYVRDQLIQLKVLEDKYTKDITTNLEKNKK
jgi:general secretion pathway protein D